LQKAASVYCIITSRWVYIYLSRNVGITCSSYGQLAIQHVKPYSKKFVILFKDLQYEISKMVQILQHMSQLTESSHNAVNDEEHSSKCKRKNLTEISAFTVLFKNVSENTFLTQKMAGS
jgi:hypothetical protein